MATNNNIHQTLKNIKQSAKEIQSKAKISGTDMIYGHALEIASKEAGFKDWNTACAAVNIEVDPITAKHTTPKTHKHQILTGTQSLEDFSIAKRKGVTSFYDLLSKTAEDNGVNPIISIQSIADIALKNEPVTDGYDKEKFLEVLECTFSALLTGGRKSIFPIDMTQLLSQLSDSHKIDPETLLHEINDMGRKYNIGIMIQTNSIDDLKATPEKTPIETTDGEIRNNRATPFFKQLNTQHNKKKKLGWTR